MAIKSGQLREKEDYQKYILEMLEKENEYKIRPATSFDAGYGIDTELLFEFLYATQEESVLKLEKLYKENDSTQNIILENRDVIYINDNKNIVYVYGQVSNEGFVPYKEGADYQYYIDKAGGFSLAADKGNRNLF